MPPFQSLKVLRTSEFLPYVVFLQSPVFEVLKATNRTAVEAKVVTKTLSVRKAKNINILAQPLQELVVPKNSTCDMFQFSMSTEDKPKLCVCQDEELQRTCDESNRIQAAYGHYFDLSIVNNNLEETYRTVKATLETVSKNSQWVAVTWVF